MNNMNEVKSPKKPVLMYYVIIFLLVILFNSAVMPAWREQQVKEVDYSTFMNLTDEKKIDKVEVDEDQILFTEKGDTKQTYKTALMNDPQLVSRLHDSGVTFTGQIVDKMIPILSILLSWVLPILIFFWIGQYMNKRFMKNMGGGPGAMQFGLGKSNAKIFVKPTDGIRFADVAGEDEAKEGLQEVVEYLHNPYIEDNLALARRCRRASSSSDRQAQARPCWPRQSQGNRTYRSSPFPVLNS